MLLFSLSEKVLGFKSYMAYATSHFEGRCGCFITSFVYCHNYFCIVKSIVLLAEHAGRSREVCIVNFRIEESKVFVPPKRSSPQVCEVLEL